MALSEFTQESQITNWIFLERESKFRFETQIFVGIILIKLNFIM